MRTAYCAADEPSGPFWPVNILDVAYWSVCVVLVGSGVAKVLEPAPFERASRDLKLPTFWGSGRLVGAAECVLGGLGLLSGSPWVALAAGVVYLLFSVAVIAAMRMGLEDCGCIGVARSEPNTLHVVLNLASVLVCIAAALLGPRALGAGLASVAWPASVAAAVAVVVISAALLALLSGGSAKS